ncbi:MAG: TerB N-terminal domain-containing protein [Dethiobacteria bacterium]|jgi:hypothetical protein
MGLFNFLKKRIKKTNSNVPATKTKGVENKRDGAINTAFAVRPDNVPPEVLRLLWFLDGPMKNYVNIAKHKSKMNVEGFVFEISFFGAEEPSAISLSLPIKKPTDIESVEKPQYYPSYGSLSPQQRWIYLNWLRNVDREINIGYVFIFYYGLERHLFFGDAEAAFNMILRLRQRHKNSSFMSYSSSALVAACIFHQKPDWFVRYMQSISDIEELAVDAIYVLAKQALGMGLTASELMNISRIVGFTNQRYIKGESVLFKQELKKQLLEKFSAEETPLSNFELKECPVVRQMIFANYSIDDQQRVINIPSIIENQTFSDMALELLKVTHEKVKVLLRELRKNGSYTPQEKRIGNKPTKEIDDAFRKSPLFEAIDIHLFDKNVEYFNEGMCPYCENQLKKRPVQKGKCGHCGNTILVKNSVFTGQKLMLTEDEYEQMVDIRKERIYRNWVKTMLSHEIIDISRFAKVTKLKNLSIEESLLEMIAANAQNHYRDSNMGLYRNSLMHLGNVYERMGQLENALDKYLLVCYYDLRGCMNGTREYNKELAFLAPAVIKWVDKLGDALNLSREQMKEIYQAIVKQLKEDKITGVIDSTWSELEEALYNQA